MTKFFYRNRHKFALVFGLLILLVVLTSCRTNSSAWYSRVYTNYSREWTYMWESGGFWESLLGWPISLLSYPIAWICQAIGKGLGNSFFWGIFFTTLIVRTLAWPIYAKTNSTSLKMQLMQPEMAKVQRKYQGRNDPRSQQQMQQEMMKLYKKYKMNPLGCIFTMLLQFPIFMSMYEVVQRTNATNTEAATGAISVTYAGDFALADTKVFGVFEMNTSFFNAVNWWDKIFAVVIALGFVGISVLSQMLGQRPPKYQKIHPNDKKTKQGGQMKWMMIIMNVVFGFMSLSNTTLAIYWLIGAIYQLGQSQIGRKFNEWQYYRIQKKNNNIF